MFTYPLARLVELVDTADLKSVPLRVTGSSPVAGNFVVMKVNKHLFSLGMHIGGERTSSDGTANQFVAGYRNKKAIININKTVAGLKKAFLLLNLVLKNRGHILVIENNKEFRGSILRIVKRVPCSYYIGSFLVGLVSNFKYVTGEILYHGKDVSTSELIKKPSLVIVRDASWGRLYLEDAYNLGIPSITLAGPSASLSKLSYPIPGNPKSFESSLFFYAFIYLCLVRLRSEKIFDGR